MNDAPNGWGETSVEQASESRYVSTTAWSRATNVKDTVCRSGPVLVQLSTDLATADSRQHQTTARYQQSRPPGSNLPAPYPDISSGGGGSVSISIPAQLVPVFDFQSNEFVRVVTAGCWNENSRRKNGQRIACVTDSIDRNKSQCWTPGDLVQRMKAQKAGETGTKKGETERKMQRD